MRPAASSNSRDGVQVEDLGRTAVQRGHGQRLARVALLRQRRGDQALHDRLRALHPHGQRGHALAEDEQQPGADAVDGLAEDGLAARGRLAEGAHDARDALVVRARDAAAVVALTGRHVQHSQELSQVHGESQSSTCGGATPPLRPCASNPHVPVSVCDVGPRDGLQNDKVTLEPAVRAELCTRLAATGIKRIEAASFVHPKLVPQMAGAEEVFAQPAGRTAPPTPASCSTARAWTARWRPARPRSTSPTRSRTRSRSATRTRPSRRPRGPPRRSSARPT